MPDINISTKLYQLLKKKHDGMFFEYDIEADSMKIYRDYYPGDEGGIVVDIDNYSELILHGDKISEASKQAYVRFLKSCFDGDIVIERKSGTEVSENNDYGSFRIEGYFTTVNSRSIKVGHISDIDEKKRKKQKKYIDTDTGLYTKAYTDEKMDDHIRIEKGETHSSLILIDIDRFADMNDAYGVKFSDAFLAEFADVLRIVFDRDYIIGKCDGDVFAVLAKNALSAEVVERASQVLSCMKEMYFGENETIKLGASIAIVDTKDAEGYYEMYDLAAKVLSYIKANGGSCVKTYRQVNKELDAPVEYLFPRRMVARGRGIEKHSVSQENMVSYAMSLMEDTHDIESSLNMLLRRIGKRYGADRVSIVTINWETLDFRYAYQWCVTPENDTSDHISKISIRDYYTISSSYNEYGLREGGARFEKLMENSIESAIYNKGRYSGALRIEVDRKNNRWMSELTDDLPLLANLVGTYLGRVEDEKTLQLKQFEMEVMSTAIKGGMKIVLDDRDRTILNISDSLCELFGYSVEEFLGITDGVETNIIYPPDMESVLAETGTRLIHDTDSYTLKYRVRCKDGTLKWVLDYGRRVRDEEGRSVFYTTCTDVSEIEESAAQIRELYKQSKTAEECTRIALQNTKTAEFFYYPKERKMVVPPRSCDIICCKSEYNDMPYDFAEDMVASQMQRNIIRAFNSVIEPGSTASCEFRIKDSERWIRITLSAMNEESGNIVVGIAEDISDETSIAQERVKIINSISDSYFAMYHIKLSEGTYSAFTQTKRSKKLIGERGSIGHFMDVFEKIALTEDSSGLFKEKLNKDIKENFINEKHRIRSYEYIHNYGTHKGWVRISFILVGMKDGKLDSFMIAFMDIDEERRKMEEQKKEHTILSLAISGSYDEIHEIDLDLNEVFDVKIIDGYAVRRKSNIGYTEQAKLIGEKYIHPDDLEAYTKLTDRDYVDKRITPENPELYMEFRLRKNIGSEEYVWKSFLHRLVPDSPTKTVMQFTTDITVRKKEDIETRKALKDAFDMANNANNAKSDFLSKMSHDIRTPMNAIIGMTSIAQKHISDTARVEDCLNKIDISSKHLLNLINDVLDMSKIESGKMDLAQEDISISEIIDGLVTMLRPSIDQKKHAFELELNNVEHTDVIGDALRIQQVFVNLLSNAIKYTPEGGNIKLTVTEKPSEYSDMAHYEFRFKDSGIGMTPQYLEKIFDPFTRAEDSRTSKIQGTGLGMTITKQIVNMMDGSISVSSEVNKGSEFVVTMFFRLQDKSVADAADDNVSLDNTDFTGKRILLAEDNEINMEIALELLSFTGAEVETACDGQEAFEKVRDSEPDYFDLVLMDVQMPRMTGYQATEAIRGLDSSYAKQIPIIACTANAFVEDIRDAEEAGMNGHVTKPIDFEQLLKVMNKWIN